MNLIYVKIIKQKTSSLCRLKRFRLEYPHKSLHLVKLINNKHCESEDLDFSNDHVTSYWLLDQSVMFRSLLH